MKGPMLVRLIACAVLVVISIAHIASISHQDIAVVRTAANAPIYKGPTKVELVVLEESPRRLGGPEDRDVAAAAVEEERKNEKVTEDQVVEDASQSQGQGSSPRSPEGQQESTQEQEERNDSLQGGAVQEQETDSEQEASDSSHPTEEEQQAPEEETKKASDSEDSHKPEHPPEVEEAGEHEEKQESEKEEEEEKEIPNSEWIDLNAEVAEWDYYPTFKELSVKEPTLHLNKTKCAKMKLDNSAPKKRPPSQGACDGYAGILHIQHGDWGGASGTIFFQFMVGMLQWADQHNFKPWVHMNDVSVPVYDPVVHTQGPKTEFTMMNGMEIGWARDPDDPLGYTFAGKPRLNDRDGEKALFSDKFEFTGTGIWEHYFEPVSDFSPGDPSCVDKPYVKFEYVHVMPGLHSHSPWMTHPWRYWMPEHIQQPDLSFDDWFKAPRKHAAVTTNRYIRFNAEMEQRAACALPNPKNSLGMHIRHGDKESSRDYIPVGDFLPYCEAFVDGGGGSIYLATDSALVYEEIKRDWPERVSSHVVRQPSVKGLSRNDTAAFNLGVSQHRTNVEALTDALAMSKCTYLLHGLSALSEASFFVNPGLTERAVNLESEARNHDVEFFTKEILPRGRMSKKKSLGGGETKVSKKSSGVKKSENNLRGKTS
jgi:hypothetical protein